jgi:hypothetical protein
LGTSAILETGVAKNRLAMGDRNALAGEIRYRLDFRASHPHRDQMVGGAAAVFSVSVFFVLCSGAVTAGRLKPGGK